MQQGYIGALEAGGTKMVLAVYEKDGTRCDLLTVPTLTPEETIPEMKRFFASYPLIALGVASFGPVDLHPDSPTYGSITSTPKLAWQDYPLLPRLLEGLNIPAAIDTDVNAAALAEVRSGAAQGCESAVYVTVGTGIGGGVYAQGRLVHGLLHPEVGHMLLVPHPDDPLPGGVCPFHKGCLEGLASGPALGARCGNNAKALPDDDPLFDLEAYYLAQMCHNLIMTLSPQKIVIGGGVMAREGLYDKVRRETLRLLNGYIRAPFLEDGMRDYIAKPALWPYSGLDGAYLLGLDALNG